MKHAGGDAFHEQSHHAIVMMAAAFAAFTVEAYLNHLGQQRVLEWGKLERRSPREKLQYLTKTYGAPT